MEQIKTLGQIISRLYEFDPEETIYAMEPWAESSPALVALEPEDELLPEEAKSAGLDYFLEIFIAMEVVEGWLEDQDEPKSVSDICNRVIEYAINDA